VDPKTKKVMKAKPIDQYKVDAGNVTQVYETPPTPINAKEVAARFDKEKHQAGK
jgi:hypothetical protein